MNAARPPRCPCCKAAGRTSGGKLGIYGHGLREKTVLGVLDVNDPSGVHGVFLRRYQCQSCQAVLTVGPWDLLPGMLYSLVTVVVALAQWSTGSTPASVRAQLGAFAFVGVTGQQTWRSLGRWACRAAEGRMLPEVSVPVNGTQRDRAARWVHIVAGAGPPERTLWLRALAGAKHYR